MKKYIKDRNNIPGIAILFQSHRPPVIDNISKPMKINGYKDSGADIAVALLRLKQNVITPNENPKEIRDEDWCFPDSTEGIQSAYDKGARIFWMNTVLYENHPITKFLKRGIGIVGQNPATVHKYDDKYLTNQLLKERGLPIPNELLLSNKAKESSDSHLTLYKIKKDDLAKNNFHFPLIVKSLRGRGSQGVVKLSDLKELIVRSEELLSDYAIVNNERFLKYGDKLILEEFLEGEEITISVMPPGEYLVDNKIEVKSDYWALPIVVRSGHDRGVAPYNGVVAVSENSRLLEEKFHAEEKYVQIIRACEKAARIISASSVIRIDCRFDGDKAYIFDLNLKPNMTGGIRENRKDQNGLTTIAVQGINWSYENLIYNLLLQTWTVNLH